MLWLCVLNHFCSRVGRSQCEVSGILHLAEFRSLCVSGLKVLAKILRECGGDSSGKTDVDAEKIQMQDDLNELGVVDLAITLATSNQEELFRATVKFLVELLDGGNANVQVFSFTRSYFPNFITSLPHRSCFAIGGPFAGSPVRNPAKSKL